MRWLMLNPQRSSDGDQLKINYLIQELKIWASPTSLEEKSERKRNGDWRLNWNLNAILDTILPQILFYVILLLAGFLDLYPLK